MINCYEGAMDTNFVVPCGLDRTEVIFDFYFSDVSERPARAIAPASRSANGFRKRTCRSAHRSSAAFARRAYTAGRLSVRRESGEHLFHRLLHADLKAGAAI